MSTIGFIRAGGLLVIVSGLALGYSYISHPHQMPPEVIASSSWFWIHMLFAVSLVLGLLGTTALYAVSAQYQYYYDGVEVFKQQTSESWVASVTVGSASGSGITAFTSDIATMGR